MTGGAGRWLRRLLPLTRRIEGKLGGLNRRLSTGGAVAAPLDARAADIGEIRRRTLAFCASLRVERRGRLAGYRFAPSSPAPTLYGTVAVLLLRHLYGDEDPRIAEEIDSVLGHQGGDGLFRDPALAGEDAEREDWWGWRHLTGLALAALALHGVRARRGIAWLEPLRDPGALRDRLSSRDWGARAAWTSNEVQNIGVMLQYARDFQGDDGAQAPLDALYAEIARRQDPRTGLFGASFETPEELSLGVQAAYHLWLLLRYDDRPVPHAGRIVDGALATQNVLGGYSARWHASACEDIDSVDALSRLGRETGHRRGEVQESLRRALPAILANLNPDGGWVFRRHEPCFYGHRLLASGANESTLFFSWFRTLGLALCLAGLEDPPRAFRFPWRFGRAPGHQFA